jgi:YegS/Rv2252/BmrU family lipid kinase
LKKYAVIINPAAGRGKSKKLENRLNKLLMEEFGEIDVFRTEYPKHAEELAAQLKNEYTVIIAAGGDGTINEIVNGMMGGKAALAVVPTGSGNDFTKMLNLPKDMSTVIKIIKEDKRKKIDIGKVGDRYFPNGMGIGFDAWVVRESMKVSRLRGFLIYLYSVIKTVFLYKNQTITFTANSETSLRDIFLIAIGNGKAMGGGFFLTPQAEVEDGQLDVCIIRALSKREVLLNLPKAIHGKHTELKQVEMLKTDKVVIRSDEGIAVHADGELLGMEFKNLEISVIPAALEVVYH